MQEEELIKKYNKEYEYLNTKCIYELRTIAKQYGVRMPAVCRKRELILNILKIGEGILPKKKRNRLKPSDQEQKGIVLFQSDGGKPAEYALKLTKEELKILSMFSYIGTRVFNYYREPQDINYGYFEFADKIYAHYYAAEKELQNIEDVEGSEKASVYAAMEMELCDDITFYEKGVFKEMLASILTEKNYPLGGEETFSDNLNAEEIYLEKLEEQGWDFVDFVAPSIEEEIRARHIPSIAEIEKKK